MLLIDNYDSFTFNLYQYFQILGESVKIIRNDEYSMETLDSFDFHRIVISPGPKRPSDAGISNAVIRTYFTSKPILGICLGHQCIGEVFGCNIICADQPVHGKVSKISHNQSALFERIPNPFLATRYHSLLVSDDHFSKDLNVIARSETKEVMGIRHSLFPTFGLQFHPESILTKCGLQLLSNWLSITRDYVAS